MNSFKRFFALLFLCGLITPNSYAVQHGPPGPSTPAPDPEPPSPSVPDAPDPDDD